MDTNEKKTKFNSAEEQKLYDVLAKMDIAKRVVQICLSKEHDVNSKQLCLISQALHYFPNAILTDLQTKVNSLQTFRTWDEMIKKSRVEGIDNCNDDQLIRDIVLDFYLVKKILPTKDAIFKTLNNTNKFWLRSKFEINMKMRGYQSRRLPRSIKTIIVEDPERSFARINYLHKIERFRKSGVPVIYVEEKITTAAGCFYATLKSRKEEVTIFYVAVCPAMGIISRKVYNIPSFSMPNNNVTLLSWIKETIIPQLSAPSILVLEDKIQYVRAQSEVPTVYSSKNEMINWLEQNDVAHNPNMHSAELFELVKKSKHSLLRNNIYDKNLMTYGHKVLLRPSKTQYLNYFNSIWKKIFSEESPLNINLFNKVSINNWQELETRLIETERKTLKEDITLNETIEKILTFAANEPLPFYLIENCDDGFDGFKMDEIVLID